MRLGVLDDYGAYDESVFSTRPAVGEAFAFFLTCNGTGTDAARAGFRLFGTNIWETVSADVGVGFLALGFFDFCQIGPGVYNTDVTMENVKIWDRVLSDDELDLETRYRRVLFPTSLNSHFHLSETNAYQDSSGNGYHLVLNGSLDDDGMLGEFWMPKRQVRSPVPIFGSLGDFDPLLREEAWF